MSVEKYITEEEKIIWSILESVTDPEIPVLSIIDLGIVRNVELDASKNKVTITITPTYTGCPAMDMITLNIRLALIENGYQNVEVISILSPPWSTDWMTEAGKEKLQSYGIAPPKSHLCDTVIACPQCHSTHTELISQFGSTACKALYRCNDCKEPFDYFKCH